MSSSNYKRQINTKIFAANLQKLLAALRMTQAEFAERIGVAQPMVSGWLNAKHFPNKTALNVIYREFRITEKQLCEGSEALDHWAASRESTEAPPLGEIAVNVIADIVTDRYGKQGQQETKGGDAPITLRSIPILEDKIAAGPGRAVDFDKAEDYALIPSARLNRQAQYYLLRISGDSMEPVLRPGDLILVNLSRNDPRHLKDRIVAAYLPDEEGATVKVLREDESGKFWILQARNSRHRDRVLEKKEEGVQFAAVEGAWVNFELR